MIKKRYLPSDGRFMFPHRLTLLAAWGKKKKKKKSFHYFLCTTKCLMKTAQFYDARSSLVDDALESLVRTNSLLLIKEHRVVVSPHSVHGRVAVISGGGSGHEPSHAGFVGSLLDAAVCGDVFASPSVAQIGAALSHLHSKGAVGVLCVVKNYTGDRLNFGIAAERSSIPTLLVFVDDDVTPSAKPRGLAATLFVHKVASVLAREGKSLAEIADACNRVISNSFTIGATLRECDIPGLDKKESSRIAPGFIEIGMGIHGEDGWEKVEYANCSSLTSDLANRLSQEANDGKEFAVIVNNLGSCSGLEIGCVIKGFLKVQSILVLRFCLKKNQKTDLGRKCTLLASGSLMTALNMHGFSISILNLDQEVRRALMVPAANCPLQFSPISDDWLIAVPEQSAANFEKTFESMDWIETACEGYFVFVKKDLLCNAKNSFAEERITAERSRQSCW
jgi:dihydroxyacetone kinase